MSVNERLRHMRRQDLADQRTAEDLHYLGARPDPTTMTDDDLVSEARAGNISLGTEMAEARARHLRDPAAGQQLMMEAARRDAAWSRRHKALTTELERRARAALDAATPARVRGRAIRLRQTWLTHGGDRLPAARAPRYLTWDELLRHEAAAWAALAVATTDR